MLENPNGVEQILAHRIGCQRAFVCLPVQQSGYQQLRKISRPAKNVNTDYRDLPLFHTIPQALAYAVLVAISYDLHLKANAFFISSYVHQSV